MPRIRRFVLLVVAASLLTAAAAPQALAQKKNRGDGTMKSGFGFRVGEKVEADYGFKWLPATIVEIRQNSIKVKLKESGQTVDRAIQQVRKVAKPAAKGENPFESVEERANKNGPRTWTDSNGEHKIEASLVRFEDGKVTLKRKDGKEIVLPLEKLSEADQNFLTGEDSDAAESGEDKSAGEIKYKLAKVDPSTARIADVGSRPEWTYVPEGAVAEVKLPSIRVGLGERESFDDPQRILLSPDKGKAIVVYLKTFGSEDHFSRIVTCDLKGNKVESTVKFVPNQVPLDMTPDMAQVIARSTGAKNNHDDKKNILFLYDVAGKKPTLRYAWQADRDREIRWARFLDKDHLLTLAGDRVVMWNVSDKVEAAYQTTNSGFNGMPALSAQGKYLAVLTRDGLAILHALSGKAAGLLPVKSATGAIGFDNEGSQLALVGGGRLRVWDLKTRELTRDFSVGGAFSNSVEWLDKDHLMAGSNTLVDVPHRVVLWRYMGLTPVHQFMGGKFWYVGDHRPQKGQFLCSTTLPAADDLALVKYSKPEDLVVVQPGMKVGLEVNTGIFPQHRQKIYDDLKRQLEAAGMVVADGGPVKLVATITPGKTKTMSLRIGFSRHAENHQITEQITSVQYQVNGKTVWSSDGVIGVGFREEIKDGENIDQALNRIAAERAHGMGNLWLPGWIAALPNGKTAGSSETP